MKKHIVNFSFFFSLILLVCFLTTSHAGLGNSQNELMQFQAGGHIMGFEQNKVYLAALSHALGIEFLGTAGVMPEAEAGGGSDGQGAPALKKLRYTNMWPGISVIYEAGDGVVAKSTYRVEPGADAGLIQLCYNVPAEVQGDGSLRFTFQNGYMSESAPIAWQEIGDKRVPVPVAFTVTGENTVGFHVKGYDPRYPLVIDPTYQWHTFYGSGSTDYSYGIAIDGNGGIYVVGESDATWNGPIGQTPIHNHSAGNNDIVVVKLSRSGAYLWHTFYGPGGGDSAYGYGIAIDGSGNVYVTGQSEATFNGDTDGDNAGDETNPIHNYSGNDDLVVAKFNGGSGAYLWHTFYGPAGNDAVGYGIAVDGSGNVYITGQSEATFNGDTDGDNAGDETTPIHNYTGGINNLVVAKFNGGSGAYLWHTFYGPGGGFWAYGYGIAVDGSGNVYVTGKSDGTWNGDTDGDNAGDETSPIHNHSGGPIDLVVAKFNGGSGAYLWHTFYGPGGGASAYGYGIAIDGSGNVYVTGTSNATFNGDTNGDNAGDETPPIHNHSVGNKDIVVVKFNGGSGAYLWHTFYGSGSDDEGNGIAIGSNGNVYITGYSITTWNGDIDGDNVDETNPLHAHSLGGPPDIVITKFSPGGAYLFHTFYGGTNTDEGHGIVLEGTDIYVTGYSYATWNVGATPPLHAFTNSGIDFDITVLKILQAPGAFSKMTPTDTGTGVSVCPTTIDPNLTWEFSTTGGYQYCIDTTDDNICQGGWKYTTNTFAAEMSLIANTTYAWQVRVTNAEGTTYANGGDWWTLTTQAVLPGTFSKGSPEDGETDELTNPGITWYPSCGAETYEYCIDQTDNDACDASWVNVGNTTVIDVSGLNSGETYYYQIRSRTSTGTTDANGGTWWSFVTIGGAPEAFLKTAPDDGATGQLTNPNLMWGSSASATSYEYCIDQTDDNTCNASWISTGSNTNVGLSGLASGATYYWQARARNAIDVTQADGGSWFSFTTQAGLPAAFVKTSPVNGVSGVTTAPILMWDNSLSATSYEYCIDQTNNNACDGSWVSVGTSTNVAISGLINGTTYYWQVAARNASGTTQADNNAWWRFTTMMVCTDTDGDGYGNPGSALCSQGSQTDCDDSNPAIYPGATEIYNGLDDNCNTQVDEGFEGLCAPIHRFWSEFFMGHFYTISEADKDYISVTWPEYWEYEGEAFSAFTAQVTGAMPVYRFWSPVFGHHFYTISEADKDYISVTWPEYWEYEGVAFYAYTTEVPGTLPVYRFWSDYFMGHFYTISEADKDYISVTWPDFWLYEGIAFYAYPVCY